MEYVDTMKTGEPLEGMWDLNDTGCYICAGRNVSGLCLNMALCKLTFSLLSFFIGNSWSHEVPFNFKSFTCASSFSWAVYIVAFLLFIVVQSFVEASDSFVSDKNDVTFRHFLVGKVILRWECLLTFSSTPKVTVHNIEFLVIQAKRDQRQ